MEQVRAAATANGREEPMRVALWPGCLSSGKDFGVQPGAVKPMDRFEQGLA